MTEYISNAEYRRQKSALTRAINDRGPVRVLVACERVLDEWQGKAWPDDWSRWARSLEDAFSAYQRGDHVSYPVLARFRTAIEAFWQ